jgi:predicted phage terminase large subunit-like protein
VHIHLPQDPGSAGKDQIASIVADLAGYVVRYATNNGDKITRYSPFSAQAEAGNVSIVRGGWNERFLSENEAFPEARHDDCPDATATAFKSLTAYFVTIGTGFVGIASREQEGWSVLE